MNATEVKTFSNFVAIAQIQRQLIRYFVTEAKQTLVSKARVAVGETVSSGNVGTVGENKVIRFGIRAQDTKTQADIGLDLAFAVEVVNAVQHEFHGLQVTSCGWNRTGWSAIVGSSRNAQVVIAIAADTFKAEAVVEAVTKTEIETDGFISVGRTAHRTDDIAVGRIMVELARKSVSCVGAGVPPVLSMCDKAGRRKCGRGCRAHKSFLHTQSPFVCRMTGLSSAAGSYGSNHVWFLNKLIYQILRALLESRIS